VARERRHLGAALDLEQADGVGLLQHAVDRGVVGRQVRVVDPLALVLEDHRRRLFERAQHAEAEQVDLDDPEVGAVVLVPLHHHPTFHRRRLERHHLVEAAGRDHHAARVLPEVAGEVLDLPPHLGEEPDAGVDAGIEASALELGVHVLVVAAVGVVGPAPELLRERVDLVLGVAQDLRHLARRHAVAVGDHVGGHGGAARAVARVQVLDDLLALIARRQVEVDVGPFAALLRQEAFEQELHLHRIDRGDRERVADRAVRRRAAALDQDLLLLAEAHDVPHDEEVALERELLDQRQLLLDLALGLRGERTEARARAVPGELAQVGRRRLAGRERVVGEAVAEVGEREVELTREVERRLHRLRAVAEEGGHLARVLEVALALGVEEGAGLVETGAQADAGEQVEQALVVFARVAHTVGGDDRQSQARRQLAQRLVALLLAAQRVALELDREATGKETVQPFEEPPRRVGAGGVERARERTLLAPGQAPQAGRVRGERVPADAGLALGVGERAGGEQAAQVLIARAVLNQEREPALAIARELHRVRLAAAPALRRRGGCGGREGRAVVDHHLGADQRFDPRRLRRLVEARRAVHAVAVDQGDGG
jgi:hypothetical protein